MHWRNVFLILLIRYQGSERPARSR